MDLDGTLADSLGVMKKVYERFLEGYHKIPDDNEFEQLKGPPLVDVVRKLQQVHGLPGQHQQLLAEYGWLTDEAYEKVVPMPGAEAFLVRAKKENWITGVVTSNSIARSKGWLVNRRLDGMIDVMVCGDDVIVGKPNPEPYLLALKRAECEADAAIAIEDSPQGATASVSAGIRTVGLNTHSNTLDHWPDGVRHEFFFSEIILDGILENFNPRE
jgi:HAD superfamily hydrolase (TIGR01509 family)